MVTSAAEYKSDSESVSDPVRVGAVVERVRSLAAEHGADPSAIEAIYRVIITEGIRLEAAAYQTRATPRMCSLSHAPLSGVVSAEYALSRLMDVMATMRAMRRLDDRPVAPELLNKLVQAASWAPVGGNRQDYRFIVITDRSQLVRLAPHWSKAMGFYLGALRPSLSPAEFPRFERVVAAMGYQCEHFADIPALIVVCFQPSNFWRRLVGRPRTALRELSALSWVDRLRVVGNLGRWAHRASAASVYPAVENLLLAARAHDLAATLTTWHSAFEQDFKAVLKIPRAVHIYAIVPVGYPLGHFGPVRRRPVEELLDQDYWRPSRVGR